MAIETIGCPHCRLAINIDRARGGLITYDKEEWKRRCKRPDLGDPAMCLSERNIGKAVQPKGLTASGDARGKR